MSDSQIRRSVLGFDPEKNAHEMSAKEWAACQAWLTRGKNLEQAKQLVRERLEQAEKADAAIAEQTKPVEDPDWFKKACLRCDGFAFSENEKGELVTSAERAKGEARNELERRKYKSEMDLIQEKYAKASGPERVALEQQLLARLGMVPKH